MDASKVNTVTNIIGFLLALLEPVHSYLASTPFSWPTFISCVLAAGIAYYTGKTGLKPQGPN